MFILENEIKDEIKDIKAGSDEFLKDQDKPNFLVDNTKGIKSEYILNKVFRFLDNKNSFTAKLFKYNKKLMQTDTYKKSFFYNKFLKVILIDQGKDVISKVFNNVLQSTISSLEKKLSSVNTPSIHEKFCFDPTKKEMHPAFKCRLSFFAMENILFRIVSLQNSDFFDLLELDLGNKDYISENILIDAITKIVNKTSQDRANQLFDIINSNEDYKIKPFSFYANKANLKFPEEENRDLIFARLCYIQAEQLNEDKKEFDFGRPKSGLQCLGLNYKYDLRKAYQAVYPNEANNCEKQPKNLETLTTDLNNFKNQLEAQNLRLEQKQEIELKIKYLNRLIEIKKYTNTLDQIKTNNKSLFDHTDYNDPFRSYKFAYYFMYAENPNKLSSVDFKTETYLSIAEELEDLYGSKDYYPQFKSAIEKIFDHQGDFDQKFYECIMRYTNFNKYLTAYIYMDNEHDPYCPYKELYTGKSYRLFTESKFYAPLKDMIQNKPKIPDGIKMLRSLKHSNNLMSYNKQWLENKNPYERRNELSSKEQKLSNIFSKRLIIPRIRDERDHQGNHFREAIKPNQENNEIINKEGWPDLNVDKNKKNIYEEWRNKITKTSELYEKHYKEPAKIELKNKLSKLNKGLLVHQIFNKIRTEADRMNFINQLNGQINDLFNNLIARRKKHMKKKLIIGSSIAFICVCILLYLNLIAGIVSFVIGVSVLVFYGISKSKSNKIQNRLQIPLKTEIKSGEINDQDSFLARFKNEHAQEWQRGNANLIFPEIQQSL